MSDHHAAAQSPATRGPIGALELWHPSGAATTRLAVGALAGSSRGVDGGAPADLVVVAPEPQMEGADALARSIASAAPQLADDGVLWVLTTPRGRARAERALGRSGLALRERLLTLPAWPACEHFVPLRPEVVRDATVRHLEMSLLRTRAVRVVARTAAGRRALARMAPGCALVASRSPSVPMHRWLEQLDSATSAATMAVACSDRRDAAVATILRFPAGRDQPDLVVKRGLNDPGAARVRAERSALAQLSHAATQAGFAVPAPLPDTDESVLASPVLPGQSAAWSLAHGRAQLAPLAAELGDRLLGFARATTVPQAPRGFLDSVLIQPAVRIARANRELAPYVDALRSLADRVERDEALVACAVHNDLTMSNVLLADAALGLIDWESAGAFGLPLTDLWYALADAVARARRTSQARAVEMLVARDSSLPARVVELPERHAAMLGLSRDCAVLGFHACWLQHARDELERGVDGPYIGVVEAVVRAKLHWPG